MATKVEKIQHTPEVDIISVLTLILSVTVTAAINIIVSGHLLGYAFSLAEDDNNHFTINIPFVIYIKLKGKKVIAGFVGFAISLLIVILFFSDMPRQIFIDKYAVTCDSWSALQAMAALISVPICLVIALIRYIYETRKYVNCSAGNKDSQIVRSLTEKREE